MKILHTADLHLGMKFAGYPEVQQELAEARFQTLERLVERANRENLFYLQWDAAELAEEITPAMIDREFTAGSFPHRLLSRLAGEKADFEALQKAYHLLAELKR